MSKSPSLRRIQADIRELALDPSDRYHAAPLEDDMFEWHFTIRGPDGTEFEGGMYHGRILLPPEYPFKPPHIIFLTPSGRFETNTKICLSFSAYHPELWQPAWGIRLILEALISFLPTPADGAIGALDWTKEERRRLAKESVNFVGPVFGPIKNLIPPLKKNLEGKKNRYQKDIELLHMHQIENEKNNKKGEVEEKKDKLLAEENKKPYVENNDSVTTTSSADVETTPVQTSTPIEAPSTTNSPVSQPTLTTTTTQVTSTTTSSSSWLTDPVLHGSIVTFAAIAYLLYRKILVLLEELEELED